VKKRKAKTSKKEYTLNEFLGHFRALPTVRRYQHISRSFPGGLEQVEIGDDRSFEMTALRVMDYFHQVYSDGEEAMDKAGVFMLIVAHLANHRASYDSERFAVFTDTDQASMISVPLLRAVHHHFTRCHICDLPPEASLIESIKEMARKLSNDEKD
jgi:hypothetical protein